MKTVRTLAAAATGCCALVAVAAPVAAAPARTLVGAHMSVSGVAGALPVGAGITVIQHCPVGSDLDRAATRAVGEFHDGRLRVASRELWPAGAVVRYRVTRAVRADDPALVATAALCTVRVPAGARTAAGRALVDLRVWGPAPARVGLLNVAFVAVTDDLDSERTFRTSLRAAGVTEHRASLRGAVLAMQEVLEDEDGIAVVAEGETRRTVARGSFVSMQNRYRYSADLTRVLR